MSTHRPQTVEEYRKWLVDQHDVRITERTCNYYASVSSKMRIDFTSSTFWTRLDEELRLAEQEYYIERHYYLFTGDVHPDIKTKPFSSFLQKTYRKNIIQNPNWPEPPDGGWILPDNWYVRINDIIRTLFVVKYLDGVAFLADRLCSLLSHDDLPSRVDYEAREEGYYAAHLYTQYECEIPAEDWDTKKLPVTVEIQITTQLQELIRTLLHRYYEERRTWPRARGLKWQWDYTSDEFAANYLGHILHYVEGMIVDIRDKQREAI